MYLLNKCMNISTTEQNIEKRTKTDEKRAKTGKTEPFRIFYGYFLGVRPFLRMGFSSSLDKTKKYPGMAKNGIQDSNRTPFRPIGVLRLRNTFSPLLLLVQLSTNST